jgi:glycosyltransferase involved in cell wall biosynthesis
MWQHLNHNEESAFNMKNTEFVDQISQFIYVSDWQMKVFSQNINIPLDRSKVIRNAIDPIEYQEKSRTGKLKLIYTSTPWRGLDVLLDAFRILNRDDIELDVYSSTVIYGKDFLTNKFNWLFDQCRNTKNVNYRGYALNKAVRKAVQSAHIFAYPNTFEETSCLCAIEAGAAGCRIVTTDYGALTETCGDHAVYVNYNPNRLQLAEEYASILDREIDNYWSTYPTLRVQSEYFNTEYSWGNRKNEWITLFEKYAKSNDWNPVLRRPT